MSRFSETVMEHFSDPQNRGTLEDPDLIGAFGVAGQGPFFTLQLKLCDRRIEQARFECNACGATVASGSVLTELVLGKTLNECRCLTTDDLLQALDGLPADKRYCAQIAIKALQQAIQEPSV